MNTENTRATVNNTDSSRKMTSIARKINARVWFDAFSNLMLINIVLFVMGIVALFSWCENQVPDDKEVANRNFDYKRWSYVVEIEKGEPYLFPVLDYAKAAKPYMIVLGVFEVLILFEKLFGVSSIRKKMRPLQELAIRAEELSRIDFDNNKIEYLEYAISHVKADAPDITISTGDKELQSIEMALNTLLKKIKNSQRQQARFVSDASHELRTPIAVIEGYVNMLDRWGKEDELVLAESIEALKNESQHMKNLVEQLLFLARGDSGRNSLKMESFILTDIIRDVFEESLMIDEKHKYIFNCQEGILVTGDISMIKQSARIFVQNAAKYSDEGNTIEISVKMIDGVGCYMVQDEGCGIPSEELEHVFERFYRSDKARNSQTGGSGLGLSIAKWIIDAHEGTIEIISRQEIGTRITVKLKKEMQCTT